jgi:ligand-binding sensor domain-containing protein/signal transduction histidine kinase
MPASALDPGRRLTQYLQRIWQARQGLPQSGIFAIHQTKDGYLWLGTSAGLVRFDGVRFTPPGDLDGLALLKMPVRQLAEDAYGRLWVATGDAGLFRIDRGTGARFSVVQFSTRDGLPSNNVTCLFAGRHDDVWACTDRGLARIADGRVQAIGAGHLNVRAAAESADGSVWMGGDSSVLTVWNGTAITHFELHTLPAYARVQSMLAGSGHALWIGTTAGLVRLKNGREQRFTKADGLANDSVLALAEGHNGSIWVGTDGGFSRCRGGELESFLPRNGLSQSTVAAVYEDREGSLWVGTKRGLNQFVDRRTLPLTTAEGLPSDDTGPVYQDARGVIWVGTLGAGLARFERRQSSVLTRRDGLASDSILSLAGDANGTLWVGTDAGLDRIRDGKITLVLPGVIRSLCPTSSGDVWIGTSKGLAVLRSGRILRLAPSGAIASLVESGAESGGKILAAVEGVGIRAYDERSLRELPNPSLAIRDADTLFRDPGGAVWIGGVGSGLHLLDGDRQVDFSMSDGLFDDEIYGIAADDRRSLWFASSTGIFSVSRRELLDFAAGRIHHVTSTPFSPLDGLQTVECKPGVQPAAWRMRDGWMSFSTIRGLIAIDSDRLALKMDPPPVVIEDVAIDGRSQIASPQAAPRKLSPRDQNLEFRYTALSLRAPQRITFRYKLEGFDSDWVDAGTRRQAFYTNLRPGDYRFRVTACNADGTCNQAGASFAFVLPARFYQQTWFYFVCALCLAGLARFGYVFRIRHMERQFGAILAERSRIARELHDTLLQGFSGVTMEMQALAARMPAGTRDALRDIIHDAANCLTEARRSVSGLRRTPAASPGLAAELAENARQLTASSSARLKLNIEKRSLELPAYVEYNLLRIAQEAIVNAVKHSGARNIEVSLQVFPERLRMVVADDGSGFTRAEAAPDHFGLVGIQERAQELGAELRVTSQPRAGTSVAVDVPIRAAACNAAPQEVKAEI